MDNGQKVFWVLGSMTTLLIGAMVIPRLLKLSTAMMYKRTHKNIEFDPSDTEPRIIRKNTHKEGE